MEALKASVAAAKKQAERRAGGQEAGRQAVLGEEEDHREAGPGAQEGRRGVTWPEGYRGRAATRDDLDTLAAVLEAADVVDVGFADPARDEIVETWAEPWFDLATDSLVVLTADDTPVGYADVVAKDASIQVFGFARIHPTHRGRGLGALAAGWLETRAADKIPSGTIAPFRSFCPATDRAADALLSSRGYRHVRSFWHMERPIAAGEPRGDDPAGHLDQDRLGRRGSARDLAHHRVVVP